jgi:hypothetical protein
VCNITASCNIKHVQQASTDWLNITFHGPVEEIAANALQLPVFARVEGVMPACMHES